MPGLGDPRGLTSATWLDPKDGMSTFLRQFMRPSMEYKPPLHFWVMQPMCHTVSSLPTWKSHIVRAIAAVSTPLFTIHVTHRVVHPVTYVSGNNVTVSPLYPKHPLAPNCRRTLVKLHDLHRLVVMHTNYRCARVFSSLFLHKVDALTQYERPDFPSRRRNALTSLHGHELALKFVHSPMIPTTTCVM